MAAENVIEALGLWVADAAATIIEKSEELTKTGYTTPSFALTTKLEFRKGEQTNES